MIFRRRRNPVPVIEVNPLYSGDSHVSFVPLEDIDDVLEDLSESYDVGVGQVNTPLAARVLARQNPGHIDVRVNPGFFAGLPLNKVAIAAKRATKDLARGAASAGGMSSQASFGRALDGRIPRQAGLPRLGAKTITALRKQGIQPAVVIQAKPSTAALSDRKQAVVPAMIADKREPNEPMSQADFRSIADNLLTVVEQKAGR
jgi:hypothetical protein